MIKTMYAEPGIGLAAPQVNANVQMIVVDPNWMNDNPQQPLVMCNPEIQLALDKSIGIEACLSVPGLNIEVERAEEIEVQYMDLEGEEKTIACDGWEARVIQHEIDHLNGILLIDYLSPLRRKMYLNKFKKRMRIAKKKMKRLENHARNYQLSKRRVEKVSRRSVCKESSKSLPEHTDTSDGSGGESLNFNPGPASTKPV